jgi:hypothetical protein
MVLHGLNVSKSVHGGKSRESKTGKSSLNRYEGPKLNLIKSLRADLYQNKVDGPKLNLCKTWGAKIYLTLILFAGHELKWY